MSRNPQRRHSSASLTSPRVRCKSVAAYTALALWLVVSLWWLSGTAQPAAQRRSLKGDRSDENVGTRNDLAAPRTETSQLKRTEVVVVLLGEDHAIMQRAIGSALSVFDVLISTGRTDRAGNVVVTCCASPKSLPSRWTCLQVCGGGDAASVTAVYEAVTHVLTQRQAPEDFTVVWMTVSVLEQAASDVVVQQDIVRMLDTSSRTGSVVSPKFVVPHEKGDSVLLDALRWVHGVSQPQETAKHAGVELHLLPRLHGYDATRDEVFAGSLDGAVGPLVEGSALAEYHAICQYDNASCSLLRRTVDVPLPVLWVCPGATTLRSLERATQWLSNPSDIQTLLQIITKDGAEVRKSIPLASFLVAAFTTAQSSVRMHSAPVRLADQGRLRMELVALVSLLRADAVVWRAASKIVLAVKTLLHRVLVSTEGAEIAVPKTHKQLDARVELLSRLRSSRLLWDPFCSCTGINIEAINFLVSLEAHLPVQAVANADCWCAGFPRSDVDTLARLRSDDRERHTQPPPGEFTFWVTHKPVDFFPHFPYRGATTFAQRPSYVVGRTMIEHDRWDQRSVATLNDASIVDEIWVPCPFLVDVLRRSGVRTDRKVVVIPEAIDVHFYSPDRFPQRHNSQQRRLFRFASNFKWEPRKGWDVLLEAYFAEFRHGVDPVELTLKTYLYSDPAPRDVRRIQQRVAEFVSLMFPSGDGGKRSWEWVCEHLPPIRIEADETLASDMPAFYAEHDAFVLPSRGEGWGLPYLEAMSMGLPCIGTRWSGMLSFMNDNNSLLVDVSRLETPTDSHSELLRRVKARLAVPEPSATVPPQFAFNELSTRSDAKAPRSRRGGLWPLRDDVFGIEATDEVASIWGSGGTDEERRSQPRWAEPSVRSLRKQMRLVVTQPDEAAAIGRRAREDVVLHFSRERVSEYVTRRLLRILDDKKR